MPTEQKTTTGGLADCVSVALGERSYDIHVGSGVLDILPGHLKAMSQQTRVVVVTDENVATHHQDRLTTLLTEAGLEPDFLVLSPGEGSKTWPVLEQTASHLIDAQVERQDLIIAFGGGVIGDLTGFAASVLRRGINFIQVPTSLLAQVDSSVGGKTGINISQGKNLIGAFHQPRLVLADVDLLDTLPARQMKAGYAEVIKYGLLGDRVFFEWLEINGPAILAGDKAKLTYAVAESCRAKARIVAEDEREGGVRALLNLGHTFGHALEAATGYSERLFHGEGVAIGMMLALEFSVTQGLCPGQDASRARAHMEAMGLPVSLADIPGEIGSPDSLAELMKQDKKVEQGRVTFILNRAIGEAFVAKDVNLADVRAFLAQKMG